MFCFFVFLFFKVRQFSPLAVFLRGQSKKNLVPALIVALNKHLLVSRGPGLSHCVTPRVIILHTVNIRVPFAMKSVLVYSTKYEQVERKG